MDTEQIRQLWLEDTLEEIPIPESSLPRPLQGRGVRLITRELDANTAGAIMDKCVNKDGKTDQTKLMGMMLIASVRNADDPNGAAVWNNAFLQPLLSKNVKPLVMIAQQSIKQSGLNVQLDLDEEKKDSDPTIVEGSLSA
jgi:hypothetical protein